jgi:hypothetical protein
MSKGQVRLSVVGLVIVIGLWATSLFALSPQTVWTRTYGSAGSEWGLSVQQTSDGGYIIAGMAGPLVTGYSDVYLIKTDASGDTVWTRRYGSGDDVGRSVEQTSDGGYIVAGWSLPPGATYGDAYLIKTDANGDTVWTRKLGGAGGDGAYSVQQTTDGGYILAGATSSFGADSVDVYLVKTDTSGVALWTRVYGGPGYEEGYSVQQTSDGGYIVVGLTTSFGAGNNDIYLLKTDTSGDTAWTRTFGGTGWDEASSVQETSDGGYIIVGETSSIGSGSYDIYLLKTDADGDTVWTRTYGGTGEEHGKSVDQTSDGGYIIAGFTGSFGVGGDVYLIRTDADGDVVWKQTYGGEFGDGGESVQETAAGKYVVAGVTTSFGAGHNDVYLIRVRERKWKVKDKKLPLPPTPGLGNGEPVVARNSREPARLALHSSAPNPFGKGTLIRFDLPAQGEVNLSIHDVEGHLVRELVGEVRPPGSHSVAWDGRDLSGVEVSAGIYFVHLEAGGKIATGKVVVAR